MEEQLHKKAIRAWTMYDWGNSAFATTIMAAVLPVYYSTVAAANIAPHMATAYWGYTTALSALLAALISPILGAVADFRGAKKRFLTVFMIIGVTATALLYFIRTGDYFWHRCFSFLAKLALPAAWCIMTHCYRTSPDRTRSIRCRPAVMPWDILAVEFCWRSTLL